MKFLILILAFVMLAGCQSRAMNVAQNQHAMMLMPDGKYHMVYSGPCWFNPDTDGP